MVAFPRPLPRSSPVPNTRTRARTSLSLLGLGDWNNLLCSAAVIPTVHSHGTLRVIIAICCQQAGELLSPAARLGHTEIPSSRAQECTNYLSRRTTTHLMAGITGAILPHSL
ncbi:hypothetical protein BDW67DRAFT_171165 [Aspergillus spinulosporus]